MTEVHSHNHTRRLCPISRGITWVDYLDQFPSLFYAVPSTLLYFLVLVAIRRARIPYSPVFIHIFTLSCIVNLLSYWLEFFFNQVLGFEPWCSFWEDQLNNYYYLVPFYYLKVVFLMAGFFTCITLSLYQLTAITMPLDFEQKWRPKIWPITAAILFGAALLCSYMLPAEGRAIHITNERLLIRLNHTLIPHLNSIKVSLVNCIVGILTLIIMAITTIIAARKIIKIKKQAREVVDYRIFLMSAWTCVSCILYSIYQICIFLSYRWCETDFNLVSEVNSYRSWLIDLCLIPVPWFILIVNKQVRKFIFGMFRKAERSSPTPSFYSSYK